MAQINKKINKLLSFVFVIIIVGLFFLSIPPTAKAATLLGPSDYIPDDTLGETGVVHNVGFVIPLNGHNIVATDYIRIVLTNFTSVTAPTSGSGWGGVPTYGATGNVAWVTGITASVGGGIGISGMTATNPASPSDFDVTIEVANDAAGSIVYDSATTTALVISESISTSITVGALSSSLEFIGYTSPQAFVTILLNGGVAGTTSANNGGNFQHIISGLTPNQNYSVSIFAQDTRLRQTQTVSFVVGTLPNATVTISNIVLPTTMSIDVTEIYQGDIITIDGLAHPLSQITSFINPYSPVVQSNSQGVWTYHFNSGADPLSSGVHYVYAREVVVGGYNSIFTQALQFIVRECGIADLNCDGSVNLTDFSILMFYWDQYNPANPRADINNDNHVDLVDFSIMMYYWTG